MRFELLKFGRTCLLIGMCAVGVSCENADDYFPVNEYVDGDDSFCSEAKDINSCEVRSGCQPAFAVDENLEISNFEACVANPEDPTSTSGGSGGSDGSNDGGTDGSTNGGTDGSTTGGSSTGGSTTGGSSTGGSTTGGSSTGGSSTGGSSTGGSSTGGSSTGGSSTGGSSTGGSSTGGSSTGGSSTGGSSTGGSSTGGSSTGGSSTGGSSTGGSSTGGTTGGDSDDDVPTIPDTYEANCENLEPKYLYVKKIVAKAQTQSVSKVKVCHFTGNGSSHTILIACPALQAHISHDDDYIGACY